MVDQYGCHVEDKPRQLFRCITKPPSQAMTEGEDYFYHIYKRQVIYSRCDGKANGRYMPLATFRSCLHNGSIIMLDGSSIEMLH